MNWIGLLIRDRLRLAAGLAVALFLGLMLRFYSPVFGLTCLLQVDPPHAATAVAAFREYPVFVQTENLPYDGLQYAQIAQHPLLRASELPPAVDNLSYRARRILLPAVAWLLAAGRPAWITQVYSGLNVAAWLVLAALLWRVLPVGDGRGFLAWAGILFSAGALGSVRWALIDLPAATLLVAAVGAAERGRLRTAVGWLAAAALTRETSLLAGAGFATGPWKSVRAQLRGWLAIAAAAVPLTVWLIYVGRQAGATNVGVGNFGWPGAGLGLKWIDCLVALIEPEVAPLNHALTSLLALIGICAQAALILVRRRPDDPWWRVGLAYVALLLVLGPAVWEGLPTAAFRVLLPLTLAANVLVLRHRWPLAWLLACNLSVFSGLLVLRDVPRDPQVIALQRNGTAAGVLRRDRGWYGTERNPRHQWMWARQEGRLTVITWPRSAAIDTQLTLRLMSLAPRTVRIEQDGREVWRGPVGNRLTNVELRLVGVRQGRAELELIGEGPPVPESAAPGARQLCFALYDPALAVSEPVPPTP